MMGSEYDLMRGKSKKQIKNEQTKELYQGITTALHEKVGEFVAEQIVSDDEDELETYQREVNKRIDDLTRFLQREVEERKSCDRDLLERCEMLNSNMLRGHGEMKQMLEDEARERISLQRQLRESCDNIAEAIEASQRQQPRGIDELRNMMLRLDENCKRMDTSIREDLRHMLLEDARTRSSSDPRLDDVIRKMHERDQLLGEVRSAVQDQAQQCDVSERRFEELFNQFGQQMASVERAASQPKALEEAKAKWRLLEERSDRTDVVLEKHRQERDRLHDRFVGDVRATIQEQDQQRSAIERRFQDRCDQLGKQLAEVEHASLRPEALEEAMFKWRRLEQRCDSLDTALANNRTAPVEALDELRRFVQDEARQRGSMTNRLEDLQCGVQGNDKFFKDLAQEVRSVTQEQAQLKNASERHFEKLHKAIKDMEHEAVRPMLQPLEETKSMLGWLEQRCDRLETGPMDAVREVTRLVEAESLKRGNVTERLEERCDRLAAALDSLGASCQRDVAPRSFCEELRGLYKRLEERCDLMDASISNRQAAMSKPAEELRRLLQEELSRRNNKERRVDDRCDKIESTLLALQAAPAQFAAKNTNNINSVHDRIDNLEAILRDSTKRINREESRSSPIRDGLRLNDKYATLARDLKMLRGEANSLDTCQHGTQELEEKLDQITRRILDDQARLGKQANEQIANAIQGISRVESQLRASAAFDPPSRNNSFYITDEWRTTSTAAPSEPIPSPQQIVSPAISPTPMSAAACPTQMASPHMVSRSPPKRLPVAMGAGQLPQVSSQQMTSPQVASSSPQLGLARGWSREEVRPPMYPGGL